MSEVTKIEVAYSEQRQLDSEQHDLDSDEPIQTEAIATVQLSEDDDEGEVTEAINNTLQDAVSRSLVRRLARESREENAD
ncbi:hypothetical protein ACFQL7_20640 [Halocatena marina]|uniref:Uncharacterized protein n=1 Tax=Halocatena marina TaxID=2934937 RepID=A0ABD5YRQ3_9EURY|nr:hypothetical protein [Halocatena marina]